MERDSRTQPRLHTQKKRNSVHNPDLLPGKTAFLRQQKRENGSNLETQTCWGVMVFDKKEFVDDMIERGLNRNEVIKEAREEIHRTESRLRLVIDAPDNRAEGNSDHVRFLRSLMFFLTGEVKVRPTKLSDDDFQILHRLTQHLVDRDDLEPDILELIGE